MEYKRVIKRKMYWLTSIIICFYCIVSYIFGPYTNGGNLEAEYEAEYLDSMTDDEEDSFTSNRYENVSTNRTQAMSKERAEELRGTGYHNTRPRSMAEDMELKAAQVKCKKCGYHSDNGVNSMCDTCLREEGILKK